jgi:uncharacterized protein YeaO (DUF488 family)
MTLHAVPTSHVRLKRVYERPSSEDGVRILVDRLWPRGLRKADAAIDRWMKDIAPAPNCANGLVTIRSGGKSFAAATPRNWSNTQLRSMNCVS